MYSYSNCLLASLNFRLVLRSQSDPNRTAIVWDDQGASREPGYQPSQSIQILVQAESDTDMTIGLNEVRPGSLHQKLVVHRFMRVRVGRTGKE